jgi:tetratricopeptide (TPR) repeat protein
LNTYTVYNLRLILICLSICLLGSCSSHKDTATSRAMQNLTARYNYIYNANLILKEHQAELLNLYPENYDEILSLYPGAKTSSQIVPPAENSNPALEEIIQKSQTIIAEKSFSNYLDDAYLLIGKANYYKNNFYNSTEYFDYTSKAYKNKMPVFIEALSWKARSLMQLSHHSEATEVIDTLKKYTALQKKKTALPFAVQAQMLIHKGKYQEAIPVLDSALRLSNTKEDRIRWTYILGQLYEQQKMYKEALSNYRKVQKSNTAFELYFNANLNRIRVNHLLLGKSFNKEEQLLSLLKDDKSLEYNDQVYYQIATLYNEDANYQEAEQYYLLSVGVSTVNQYQKGLSYLKIADLNFNHFKNYLKAKLYYDSTVNTLPPSYRDYPLIVKKTQNLEYLTSRYKTIAHQDTLQLVAKLPEDQRMAKIESIINIPVPEAAPVFRSSQVDNLRDNTRNPTRNQPGSSFYFNNPTALSKGFSDFKRQWGNRRLEDNWRQSIKSSYQASTQTDPDNQGIATGPDSIRTVSKDKTMLIKEFSDSLPLTVEALARSNQKIIDAYFEIANYYQQELNDSPEAIRIYQLLTERYPDNSHQAAIYYSLYLGYNGSDNTKSNQYKDMVLSKYPTSVYARTILDPSFSIKQNELETAAFQKYNTVFEQYERKEFDQVIAHVDQALKDNNNYLSPQFSYLKAIAIGRTQPVDSLLNAFQGILDTYKTDKLIVPLVTEHMNYITKNLATFKSRSVALLDFDPNEPSFGLRTAPAATAPVKPTQSPTVASTVPEVKSIPAPVSTPPKETPKETAPAAQAPSIKSDGLFNSAPSQQYYFVINVSDASLTLSSSRFGIGQFNRGTYAGSNLKHQLLEFDNEQLIYVGNFSTFEEAKSYAADITAQLPKIMKVPANIYTSFVISKENFDKVTSKTLINRYLEFYKTL